MNKFRGVSMLDDGAYVAKISKKYLGYFGTFETAKKARIDAEISIYGRIFDIREIEIHEDEARLPLHGRGGVFRGWALIDIIDIDKCKCISWVIDPRGYVVGKPEGFKSTAKLHRWILFNQKPGYPIIDHIDGNKLNNKRSNLRECTAAQNSRNARISKNNSSGFKGVSISSDGKWRARIWRDWKEIFLGNFNSAEDAAVAYDKAAIDLHGEFASTNFPIIGYL